MLKVPLTRSVQSGDISGFPLVVLLLQMTVAMELKTAAHQCSRMTGSESIANHLTDRAHGQADDQHRQDSWQQITVLFRPFYLPQNASETNQRDKRRTAGVKHPPDR
jgi:hypothetical protein